MTFIRTDALPFADSAQTMEHDEFRIGLEFYCGGKAWRCTDVGTRVITAISLGPREMVRMKVDPEDHTKRISTRFLSNDPDDLTGPPYGVAESVFDEHDIEGCYLNPEDDPGGSESSRP